MKENKQNPIWDENKCVHCTACVGQCPSAAFTAAPETKRVAHDSKRCIACELCIPSCSYGATKPASGHFR